MPTRGCHNGVSAHDFDDDSASGDVDARPSPAAASKAPTGIVTLAGSNREPGRFGGSHGAVRRLLKLLVEIDSSRFLTNRLGAGFVLVTILAGFAAIGYWLPALLSRHF